MEYSTILLEAMILKKPTITILTYSNWFEDDPMMTSGATVTVKTAEEFELTLKKILNDNDFRSNLIEKGNNFVKSFLTHQGVASDSIKKLLEND
jgi:3-deoxy-D-manno-octulosonic-acid transferase